MSDKINELISNVKELIQDGNREAADCIKSIDNQIDSKQNEIREIFEENIDSVVTHYLKYHQTLFHHKRLQAECEQFSKHIEKMQKLNAYDQQQIDKSAKNLQYMKTVKNKLVQYRNYIKLSLKAAVNIKEEKYNNAIKIINEYKKNQPKLETPLKRVLPLLESKVEEHLRRLLDSFWEENKSRMIEIGRSCFSKMNSTYQQKLNIYQIFFGKSLNRSTSNNRMSSLRCTMLTKQTSSRILRQSDDCDHLNKIMVRISVEMSTLKKVKVMQVELNNQGVFNQMLRSSMHKFLQIVEQTYGGQKEAGFFEITAIIVGFLLIRREVCAFFDLKMDEKVFIGQIYLLVGGQIKTIIEAQRKVDTVLTLKQNLLVFHRILNIVKLNEHNERYNSIILQLFKSYNSKNIETYELRSREQISKDNLINFETQDDEKQMLIRQIFGLQKTTQFKFTSYVVFILDYFLKTYEDVLKLLQESDTNQNIIFQSITTLYQHILRVYGDQLLRKDQHYQIIQGEVNIIHIDKIYQYLVRQLEIYHGIINNNKAAQKYQQLMVKLTRNILEVIQQKLSKLMEDYNSTSINTVNTSHHDFVQWTLQFINHIIIFMKQVECSNYDAIIIETMRQMCELYWAYLKGLKQINLVVIYNLDLDLSFIYRFCTQNYNKSIGVLDKFKSLRQFYTLMLTNNIQDLLQPQKRNISYPNLNMEVILSMLKKYNQAKVTSPKIRQLKKKDVENLYKKLVQSIK